MSATYDQTHPTARDRVRANLGDTTVSPESSAHHTNEHMDALITAHGEPLGQAALAHELWARYAQDPVRITTDGLSVDLSSLLDVWSELAKPWVAHLEVMASVAAASARAPASTTPLPFFRLARGRRGQ